jgi:YVTN family beta-propeller protein
MLLRHSRAALPRPSPRALAALLALVALPLAACTEDTLYDGEEVTGPEVTVAPHTVTVSLPSTPPRLELGEAVRVVVTGRGVDEERGRIAQLGATVLVMNTARTDTVLVALGPETVSPPASGSVSREFSFTIAPEWVDRLRLPDTLAIEVHGWALNAAGSCVAAVQDSIQKLPCADFRGSRIASGRSGLRLRVAVAAGTTVALPEGARSIGDLVVDNANGRVYLSNRTSHRVEVLDLATRRFGAGVPVGSEPWGMSLGLDGDTLMVANSGGINVSFVHTGTLREDLARRFEIPRITLYQVKARIDTILKTESYTNIDFFNYVDRPLHVVQDAGRRLLYSAGSTRAAPEGTIRVAQWLPGWRTWDAQMLFHQRSVDRDSAYYAIANADNVEVGTFTVVITDHVPGTLPRVTITSPPLRVMDAVAYLRALGSDVVAFDGKWRLPQSVELSDTTFVTASADRRWVAFGEGVRTPAGRLIMWSAAGFLSRVEDIADITNNTSDRITGIGLNEDGSLGMARGTQAAYFFGNDLRLQGLARQEAQGGGAGFLPLRTGNRTLAFTGTGRGTIQVVETTSYRSLGEVFIRDAVAGPFKVAPPLPGQSACPADFASGPAGCVVARAYAVTAGGGVAIVDILREDLTRTAAAGRN